jgi:signal transduction histidine kinase
VTTTSPAPTETPRRRWIWPPRIDLAIAVAFVILSAAEALFSPAVPDPLQHLLIGLPAMAALAWRRQFPLAVALMVIGANTWLNPSGDFSVLLSLVLVSFTVGAETTPPRNYIGLAITLVPFMTAMILEGFEPSDAGAALVFILGPWAVGIAVRQRNQRAAEALARAAELEANAAKVAEQERTRIERELHDIVSHSLSVVTIQTQAVRRRLQSDQVREAADLAAVENTAREALAEMRRLFGVLRSEGEVADLAPQPGVAELPRLVAQAGGDGAVRLVIEGEPYPLPPGVDLAAYRIAQEGLTNALRHAEANRIEVRLDYQPTRLAVTVTDDGRGLNGSGVHGGHGLVGVRERVSLYGGTLEVGPAPSGGTRLSAVLPVRETTA